MEILKAFISWTHILSSSLSMIIGGILLFKRKGTPFHKKAGMYYFYAMVINCVSALFIYNAGFGFFFPHYLAIITLLFLIPGYMAVRYRIKNWLAVHITCLIISYYMLIGGAINEAFLRIAILQPFFKNQSPVFGMSQFAAILLFIGILAFYLRKRKKYVSVKGG